ncbi:MAG: MucBP domain-containing protein [Limosilactobacillus reuteri]|nr:MucBP domain-containing protein [Limosilactobacillus reuteri]
MGEKKLHYKMYKDGKKFVFAAIATMSFFVFGGVSTVAVHADTTSGNSTAATVNSTSDTKSAVSSAATVASSASDTKSAAQSAATAASSASDTNSFVQLMADNATAAYNSAPIDGATSQTNSDGKTQYSSLDNAQNLSFESNTQDSSAPTATGVNLTGTYTQANLPQQFKNDRMTGDTFWLYSGADLLNRNVSITKNWANAGSINGRNVDFHETFHDFVAQNNPSANGISSITGVDTNNPYLILISSNAVDNIDVYNANLQETFWFTYSDDGSIVDITKFDQAHAAQNNNQIFYFLSASLSSNNGVGTNRREYVQTNDAKTVVISKNPINDPSTGFTAPASTMGLASVSGSNVPGGLVYTNTDPWGYQSPAGEDSNPDYYALQGGVTFANFTSNKPTLYLGAVPINASNTSWWHGNHNKNSDFLSFVTYSIDNNKKVNETINYVDQTGKTVAPIHTANPITFITVKAWDGTTTYYKFGSQEDPTLDNAGKPDSSWIQADNAKFGAIDNPTVNGYHVISTNDPDNNLSQITAKIVTKSSDNLVYKVIYAPNAEKANVTYIDDTTGKTLSTKDLTGNYGSTDPYRTSETINGYESQGYQLVSDNYPTNGVVYNQDGTVQSFEVHLTHETTPVGPNNPEKPGEPINPDNPNGPKWPDGTDKNSLTQTITRTVNYYDKQTGAVVAKQVTEQVTYNRTAIVDKVTGQIIGYSTTNGDTVDQTDGNKAWVATNNDTSWAAVTSPDLSSEGYTAPDKTVVAQTTVNPGDENASVDVYYNHVVVPVNPSNPETPGEPINPDNPNGPKWPDGTDKNSLTKTVNQTIHYQYVGGQTAAPDKTDSTTFDHQVEVDKVTGKIVKDDGWSAENDKTSFDAKVSPVIAGYTASQASSTAVTGLTQDSQDNVQTIVYAPNAETANVTYIDDTTGKTLSTKDLSGAYGTTDPYRTNDTIAGYENAGYKLVSDNYPTSGVTYNEDSTVQSFQVHLTHSTTLTNETKIVTETIHYVYKNGTSAHVDYQAKPLIFTRTVTTDNVTGAKVYGSWTADQSFAAVTSPTIKGYTPDQAEIGSQTVSGDSSDLDFTVVYAKNAPTITTESKTINETIHYVYKDGTTAHDDYVAKPVEFTRQVSTDAVTGEKTYGPWSAAQSFDAVKSPELKGYTADKAQIDKQTVNGDSKDLAFTVTYTKNAPVAGGNVTAKYVDENGNSIADDVIASGNVGDPYSTTQKDVPGYTFKEVQGNPTGSFTDQDQTVTYVYTKNPATDNNGGTGLNQPGKPGNGTDTGNSSSNQPGNPSQPSNATNNGVINTSTNTGSKVNNSAVNSPELPQTGENNSQSQTMSFIGILLAMFGSSLGFLGIKKRRND